MLHAESVIRAKIKLGQRKAGLDDFRWRQELQPTEKSYDCTGAELEVSKCVTELRSKIYRINA